MQKKRGGCLKTAGIVVAVIIVIGVIGSMVGGKDDEVKKVSTSGSGAATKEETKEQNFNVGETAEYKDVQMTVLGYEESTGTDFSKPADGKEFLFVNVEIANNSQEEVAISSMLSFECYAGDYKLEFSSGALMALDSRQQMDGEIASGKKMNGYIGLEVPTDWSTVEIHFTESIWSSSKMKFIVNR